MSQFITLGLQIAFIVRVAGNLNRNRIHNFEAVTGEPGAFPWIVADQPETGNTQVPENLQTHPVVPFIHGKAQMDIGFHGIHSVFLKLISF